VNASGLDGKTALQYLAEEGDLINQSGFPAKQDCAEVIELLKKHGAR
jgi:hypothetical protein